MPSIEITEELAEELDLPWDCHTEWYNDNDHRWSYGKSGVFEYEGKHYLIDWQHPASEQQQDSDEYPWSSYEFPIEGIEVALEEVRVQKWVPVK